MTQIDKLEEIERKVEELIMYMQKVELEEWNDLRRLTDLKGTNDPVTSMKRARWVLISDIIGDLGIDYIQEGRL